MLTRRRMRLAGLVPLLTLGVLLPWPYTQAGRFLIPLIPFILLGAVEGLSELASRLVRMSGIRRRRDVLRLSGRGQRDGGRRDTPRQAGDPPAEPAALHELLPPANLPPPSATSLIRPKTDMT